MFDIIHSSLFTDKKVYGYKYTGVLLYKFLAMTSFLIYSLSCKLIIHIKDQTSGKIKEQEISKSLMV